MEKTPTEKSVRRLHQEFVYFKKYTDKLKFYDTHFSINPFSFPDFEPEISVFFGSHNIQVLDDIWQKERQASAVLKKEFNFGEEKYVFEINFSSAHRVALNDFIIENFVSTGLKQVDSSVKKILKKYATQALLTNYLNSLDETILFMEQQSKTTADRSSKTRFINVFIAGLNDAIGSQNMQVFSTAKKFIELYLYSQGKLYAYYTNRLKEAAIAMNKNNDGGQELACNALSKQRISILQQLRITDAIQLQYPNVLPDERQQKIAEIISFLIGEPDTNFILRQLRNTPKKKYLLPVGRNNQ